MTESLSATAIELRNSFSQSSGWEQRARLLLHWAERLPQLSAEEQTDDHRVHGCESQVWLTIEPRGERWFFRAFSDARLVKGLLAVLLLRIDGMTRKQIDDFDLKIWFDDLGLSKHLTPSRRDGMSAVLDTIRRCIDGAKESCR